MSLDRLSAAKKKTIGSKQTMKALQKGEAKAVFIAADAEDRVKKPLMELCREKDVEIVDVETMAELGRACGIEVGSATAAIIVE